MQHALFTIQKCYDDTVKGYTGADSAGPLDADGYMYVMAAVYDGGASSIRVGSLG